jgi:hypothetical protein
MEDPLLEESEFKKLESLTKDLPIDPYLPNRFKMIGLAQFSKNAKWDTR